MQSKFNFQLSSLPIFVAIFDDVYVRKNQIIFIRDGGECWLLSSLDVVLPLKAMQFSKSNTQKRSRMLTANKPLLSLFYERATLAEMATFLL